MSRWIFVIDIGKCVGCECCVVSCNQANSLAATMTWRRIAEIGFDPVGARREFLPLSCMHCGLPPCRDVCPTGATYKREDGIVEVDSERCMGCGYCVLACPYDARTIVPEPPLSEIQSAALPADAKRILAGNISAGIATKCNMCRPRLDAGLARGLKPGVDPEATPACVVSCLPGAMHFGDADDPASEVARLLRENRATRVHEDLGTDSAIFYIGGDNN